MSDLVAGRLPQDLVQRLAFGQFIHELVEIGLPQTTRSPRSEATWRRRDWMAHFLSQGRDRIEHMFETLIDPTSQRVASEAVPAELDDMDPGLFLAGILSSVDVDDLSGYDRVVVLRAHQKMINHHQARLYEAMASVENHCAEIFDGDAEIAYMSASAEIRCALNLTRRAADRELDLAQTLRQRLPKVWDALVTGTLDARRARTITDGTDHLPADTARAVVDQILELAAEWTTGQIAARLR